MLDLIRSVVFDEGGASAIEYGFATVLISLASIAAYTEFGVSVDNAFRYVQGLMDVAAGS